MITLPVTALDHVPPFAIAVVHGLGSPKHRAWSGEHDGVERGELPSGLRRPGRVVPDRDLGPGRPLRQAPGRVAVDQHLDRLTVRLGRGQHQRHTCGQSYGEHQGDPANDIGEGGGSGHGTAALHGHIYSEDRRHRQEVFDRVPPPGWPKEFFAIPLTGNVHYLSTAGHRACERPAICSP